MTQPFDPDPTDAGGLEPQPPEYPLPSPSVPESLQPLEPPRRRFYPLAFALGLGAWCIIAILVTAAVFVRNVAEETSKEVAAKDGLNLLMMQAQARYLLGLRDLAGAMLGGDQQIVAQATALDTGPIDQRLHFVVLTGELQGPDEALQVLDKLERLIAAKNVSLTREQTAVFEILRKLYGNYRQLRYDAPSVTPAERHELREELGWFGDLALAPPEGYGMRRGGGGRGSGGRRRPRRCRSEPPTTRGGAVAGSAGDCSRVVVICRGRGFLVSRLLRLAAVCRPVDHGLFARRFAMRHCPGGRLRRNVCPVDDAVRRNRLRPWAIGDSIAK